MAKMNAMSYAHMILGALQPGMVSHRDHAQEPHVYGGTVDYVTRQDRRVKNRIARKSRAINRRRSR